VVLSLVALVWVALRVSVEGIASAFLVAPALRVVLFLVALAHPHPVAAPDVAALADSQEQPDQPHQGKHDRADQAAKTAG
jgi:hypothetical protein